MEWKKNRGEEKKNNFDEVIYNNNTDYNNYYDSEYVNSKIINIYNRNSNNHDNVDNNKTNTTNLNSFNRTLLDKSNRMFLQSENSLKSINDDFYLSNVKNINIVEGSSNLHDYYYYAHHHLRHHDSYIHHDEFNDINNHYHNNHFPYVSNATSEIATTHSNQNTISIDLKNTSLKDLSHVCENSILSTTSSSSFPVSFFSKSSCASAYSSPCDYFSANISTDTSSFNKDIGIHSLNRKIEEDMVRKKRKGGHLVCRFPSPSEHMNIREFNNSFMYLPKNNFPPSFFSSSFSSGQPPTEVYNKQKKQINFLTNASSSCIVSALESCRMSSLLSSTTPTTSSLIKNHATNNDRDYYSSSIKTSSTSSFSSSSLFCSSSMFSNNISSKEVVYPKKLNAAFATSSLTRVPFSALSNLSSSSSSSSSTSTTTVSNVSNNSLNNVGKKNDAFSSSPLFSVSTSTLQIPQPPQVTRRGRGRPPKKSRELTIRGNSQPPAFSFSSSLSPNIPPRSISLGRERTIELKEKKEKKNTFQNFIMFKHLQFQLIYGVYRHMLNPPVDKFEGFQENIINYSSNDNIETKDDANNCNNNYDVDSDSYNDDISSSVCCLTNNSSSHYNNLLSDKNIMSKCYNESTYTLSVSPSRPKNIVSSSVDDALSCSSSPLLSPTAVSTTCSSSMKCRKLLESSFLSSPICAVPFKISVEDCIKLRLHIPPPKRIKYKWANRLFAHCNPSMYRHYLAEFSDHFDGSIDFSADRYILHRLVAHHFALAEIDPFVVLKKFCADQKKEYGISYYSPGETNFHDETGAHDEQLEAILTAKINNAVLKLKTK